MEIGWPNESSPVALTSTAAQRPLVVVDAAVPVAVGAADAVPANHIAMTVTRAPVTAGSKARRAAVVNLFTGHLEDRVTGVV